MAPVHLYVAAVSVVGLSLLVWILRMQDARALFSSEALVFAAFTIAGELIPIIVPRAGEQDEITTSTTFGLALLATAGIAPAVLALLAGSMVSDAIRRKPLWKAVFNAGQYTVSLAAAAGVLGLFSSTGWLGPAHEFSARAIPVILAAGAVFFVLNTSMTGVALALAQGVRVRGYLWRDLLAQVPTDGVLVVLTPIVLLTAKTSIWLVPLIVVPIVAVYQSTKVSLENVSLVRRLEDSLADLHELNRLNEHQALHDALTDLPNRTLFVDRVTQAIRVARREGRCVALLIVDLDRFKDINDTLGHHGGDQVLQEAAGRLRETLRDSDTVARVGGDEFGVLIPVVEHRHAAFRVADRIRKALEGPITVEGLSLHIEASTGLALFPEHGDDADTLIQRADLAMYVAKSGHSGIQVFSAKHDRKSRRRLALLGDLRRAIDDGQLLLHYQPKVQLDTGEPVGLEALLRWQTPNRGLVMPDEFIPFAEHSGLIRPLTLYVLDAALRQARDWAAAGLDLSIAVNLSARNVIDVQLPADVAERLERWDVPAKRLELEITESALMGEPLRAMQVLTTLSDMGVGLSLDDFGTGYSSLASLKRLPVNEIKIDRSFVMNMEEAESDAVIVRSTVDLGHNLGLQVVAEGVETEDVWNRLGELRCDVAQGFYLSRPLAAAAVPEWMRRSSGREPGYRAAPSPTRPERRGA